LISCPNHVVHVTENYSPENPGITEVVTQLTRHLSREGWQTTILTTREAVKASTEGVEIKEFPVHPPGKMWRYPVGMRRVLSQLALLPGTVFHLHGIWAVPAIVTSSGTLTRPGGPKSRMAPYPRVWPG